MTEILASNRDSPSSIATPVRVLNVSDNDLQPFFILHNASCRKCEKTASSSSGRKKRKRQKLDMPTTSPTLDVQEHDDERLRQEAFEMTWSKIDSTIKEVLREINITLFEEIHQWVFESFSTITSTSTFKIMKPYPISIGATCNQIPTALVFTNNIEFADDLRTFQDLKGYMQSNGCHAAYLSALDLSIKHGIESCLRSLCRQLVSRDSDAADIPFIASWYFEAENYHNPIVVIIDDMQRCDGGVLAEFVKMLSEWVMKIPIIFIMGVTTTFDAPRRLLPSSVLLNLQPCKFIMESSGRIMDSLIESVLVRSCSGFFIGHKVAVFLRNHFLRHDGTITSFLKLLKLSCAKHFAGEPLSFLCPAILHQDCEALWPGKCGSLTEVLQRYTFDLPYCQRVKALQGNNLAHVFSELKMLQNSWSSVVLCLLEVGKLSKIQVLDIFCEATDPSWCSQSALDQQLLPSLTASNRSDSKTCSAGGVFIHQAIQNVRELPIECLCRLLNQWSLHMQGMNEIVIKIRELHSIMINLSSDGHTLKEKRVDNNRCSASSVMGKETLSLNDEAAMLLVSMVRLFLHPIESAPFHEIICFKDVAALKSALSGDPRRVIQEDLLKSNDYLQITSCGKRENILSSCSHDTAIMYSIAQEYGDLINLHDWYLAFKTTVLGSRPKAKREVHASKKGKAASLENEAATQARFCKAVVELQITGLVRMPSKRRPDFLQRIAFHV